MGTVGIDIGGRVHVAARCPDGQVHADRSVLRIGQSRAGFSALAAWLDAGPLAWAHGIGLDPGAGHDRQPQEPSSATRSARPRTSPGARRGR